MKTRLLIGLLPVLVGCMTARDYGDRAFEAQKYNEALDNYEKAILEGEKDVELFVRAARASMNTGDFASAERYYSQALRHGAGIDVARELAEFYVRTNNFVSAIRVYEYLLGHVEDTRPIYNNLGTALMYAGKPFDAETYLLIAQQMDPSNALPYLNLGVLYDEHMRMPHQAIGFYRCYVDMSADRGKTYYLAAQRITEIEERFGDVSSSVECGKAYAPKADPVVKSIPEELRRNPDEPIELGTDGPDVDPTKEPAVQIDRMIKEPLAPPVQSTSGHAQNGDDAWASRRWADVVRSYSNLTVSELDSVRRYRLGAAELQLGHAPAAVSWLQLSLAASEDPATVEMLLKAHAATKDVASVERLCTRFAAIPEYKDALRECPVVKEPKPGK
jgi:tetratricopeptide (TPR) repeat protein